jgi:hypothetical protein
LGLSGAKLIGADVMLPAQLQVGRLVYRTPQGLIAIYIAPRRSRFGSAQKNQIDSRSFFTVTPRKDLTLFGWAQSTTGIGMAAQLSPEAAAPDALDARRATPDSP